MKPDGQNSIISFVISKWLPPELSIPVAGQKDRKLWERECVVGETEGSGMRSFGPHICSCSETNPEGGEGGIECILQYKQIEEVCGEGRVTSLRTSGWEAEHQPHSFTINEVLSPSCFFSIIY